MIVFGFRFPGGRYHATPWGRHVNEAAVAWPPEPVRILRALIATWWRKADQTKFPKATLDDLIDSLAEQPPVFMLPPATHTHIRAFMPAPVTRTLIFEAFLKLDADAEMVIAWPDAEVSEGQRDLAAHLLDRIGYLGRAESWAEGRVVPDWDGDFNAAPRGHVAGLTNNAALDLLCPLPPAAWRSECRRLRPTPFGRKVNANDAALLATLPDRLCDAIAVDTSAWQAIGWSSPPPMRRVLYDRPQIDPLPPRGAPARVRKFGRAEAGPEVARYLLAGRPAPRVEETLKIGDVLRRALMACCRDGKVPPELSGRDEHGPLRADPQHAHAFFLPEDADGDGFIDHLIVYARHGFSDDARHALDRLSRLWLDPAVSRRDAIDDQGRQEWRVALDVISSADNFSNSVLLGQSRIWQSETPYLDPRFRKLVRDALDLPAERYRAALLLEWSRRFPDHWPPEVHPVHEGGRFVIRQNDGLPRSLLRFARTRPRGSGGPQPDAAGASLRLVFDEPQLGPLAFGKHAHLGMGLFRRVDIDGT
ncbi:MAG: type I-U CRISPR-associated protein Cas5/Cas6 [Acetobacteraceae bacterium]|nr:type I-U CRISPR-associated protein Cas5/Cas6 [Acetobacteraceae bacterium]